MEVAEQARTAWDVVKKEFECGHNPALATIALLVKSNGAKQYGVQCGKCGEFRFVHGHRLTKQQRDLAEPRDESIRQRYYARRTERYEQLTRIENAAKEHEQHTKELEWRSRYEHHINSPKWKIEIREKIMERCGGICEGCLERAAVQVHHLTYAHLGDEFMWELRAVCIQCHERVHA